MGRRTNAPEQVAFATGAAAATTAGEGPAVWRIDLPADPVATTAQLDAAEGWAERAGMALAFVPERLETLAATRGAATAAVRRPKAMLLAALDGGQLGDGTAEVRQLPVAALGQIEVAVLSAGVHHSLGLTRAVPGGGLVQRYRPRTEGLFARIAHHRGDHRDSWEVESKDGLVSRYGTRRPGAAVAGERVPAATVVPHDPRRVYACSLTETIDTFGNRIEYRYERDPVTEDGPHWWDQLYLSEIRFVDYGDPVEPKYLVHVRFAYEDRPVPFSDYRGGFEVRTIRRCTAIDVSTDPGVETPTRTYRLVYLDQRTDAAEALPRNGVSLLNLIRVIGRDGNRTEELPPLEFGYSTFEPERRRYEPFAAPGGAVPDASLGKPKYEMLGLCHNVPQTVSWR